MIKRFDEYKTFLENLSPPDWFEAQRKRIQDKIEVEKKNYIESKIMADEDKVNSGDNSEKSKVSSSKIDNSPTKRSGISKKGSTLTKKQIYTSEFYSLLEKGKILSGGKETLNPYENELYFASSEELQERFSEKEDNNLLHVQQIQNMESNIEKEHLIKSKIEKELDNEYQLLLKMKEELIIQLNEEKKNINKIENSYDLNSKDFEKEILKNLKTLVT